MLEIQRCHLKEDSVTEDDLIPTSVRFDLLVTLEEESHIFRYILKCKICGQLYFFEFYEEIDWEKGDDPQYVTYIPVKTAEEADILNTKSSMELLGVGPRLQHDSGKGNTDEVRWVR